MDHTCTRICNQCEHSMLQGSTPQYALANGLWLGEIPPQLLGLTFAEQLLISRVRHNKCIVRVSSGMHKMKSNIIMFENPTPKIYQTLPPPLKDVDDVLAFIFTGPCRPTQDDLKRTPLLVRRRRVCEALNWLMLNHVDYHALHISQENLDQSPEDGPPVVVAYRQSESNKEAEAVGAYDNGDEEGVETGECPYILNGVVGEDIVDTEHKTFKALTAKHLPK